MRRWPVLVGLLLPGFAIHAAPPVVTERTVAGARPAESKSPADKHKTPAATMPGVDVAGQGSSAKPAWEWSDEERIRVRFDPASIQARAAGHADSLPPYAHSQVQSARAPRSSQHVLDGSRDPGLFLPAELLDVLLQGLNSNASLRAHARDALANDIRGMGYSENDFWNKLQQLSAPYRALMSRPNNLAVRHVKTSDGKTASFLIDADRCVARHSLLQSARAAFGAQIFQKFLYTAVAPQVWRSDTTQSPDPAQEMIFVAAGCR
jgi:hypothetical protein